MKRSKGVTFYAATFIFFGILAVPYVFAVLSDFPSFVETTVREEATRSELTGEQIRQNMLSNQFYIKVAFFFQLIISVSQIIVGIFLFRLKQWAFRGFQTLAWISLAMTFFNFSPTHINTIFLIGYYGSAIGFSVQPKVKEQFGIKRREK